MVDARKAEFVKKELKIVIFFIDINKNRIHLSLTYIKVVPSFSFDKARFKHMTFDRKPSPAYSDFNHLYLAYNIFVADVPPTFEYLIRTI